MKPFGNKGSGNWRIKHLPEHWQEYVKDHPQLKTGSMTEEFDYKGVKLWFDDGSKVHWKYAFLVIDMEHQEVCVFTEHNLYHVYPAAGIRKYKVKGEKHKGWCGE